MEFSPKMVEISPKYSKLTRKLAGNWKLTTSSPKPSEIQAKIWLTWTKIIQNFSDLREKIDRKLEIDHPIPKIELNFIQIWVKSIQNIQNWQGIGN